MSPNEKGKTKEGGCQQTKTGSQAVDAVNQIDGIDNGNDDEYAEKVTAQVAYLCDTEKTMQGREANISQYDQYARTQNLKDKFLFWRNQQDIVLDSCVKHDDQCH